MFLSRNKKNNVYHCQPQFYYIKVGLRGVKIIQVCSRDAVVGADAEISAYGCHWDGKCRCEYQLDHVGYGTTQQACQDSTNVKGYPFQCSWPYILECVQCSHVA